MARTKTTREQREVIGCCNPACDYTTEGCMHFWGLGEKSLDEGRAAGVLRPYMKHGRLYYLGTELQAWIRTGERKAVTA